MKIHPADHAGVPMCSHLACPAYIHPPELGAEPRCLEMPGRPTDVCIPAVRLLTRRAEEAERQLDAERAKAVMARRKEQG